MRVGSRTSVPVRFCVRSGDRSACLGLPHLSCMACKFDLLVCQVVSNTKQLAYIYGHWCLHLYGPGGVLALCTAKWCVGRAANF